MHEYVNSLMNVLVPLQNPDKANQMKAYMKNHFDFLGIPTPERRGVSKEQMKKYRPEDEDDLKAIIRELWLLNEREYQYCAMELLFFAKKTWSKTIIYLIEFCLTNKSWWDTVDLLATDCAGFYFKKYPEQIGLISKDWNTSNNMWLQRSSLLFQKNYKKDLDTSLLSEYILNATPSKEFFIQKAVGWILREYAKTNAEWVIMFVNQHKTVLPLLSKREALKHLSLS